jgi:hypothetical protein
MMVKGSFMKGQLSSDMAFPCATASRAYQAKRVKGLEVKDFSHMPVFPTLALRQTGDISHPYLAGCIPPASKESQKVEPDPGGGGLP